MPLRYLREPFDDADWLFELKYDGYRALAYLQDGTARLLSRGGNWFKSFPSLTDTLASDLPVRDAIIDGEVVCLDKRGRPRFNDLLFRRGTPSFVAFDLLWVDGRDLRHDPLHERKAALKALLRNPPAGVLYADHIEGNGIALFNRVCELDVEGIVAKLRYGPYVSDRDASSWVKIRNPRYSQWQGRAELFERDRHREPVAGWHICELACALASESLK